MTYRTYSYREVFQSGFASVNPCGSANTETTPSKIPALGREAAVFKGLMVQNSWLTPGLYGHLQCSYPKSKPSSN